MSQNYAPASMLRFHDLHGTDLRLSNNNTTASRDLPGTSLLFSSRPLNTFQKFVLKLAEISTVTKEVISVGFTSRGPSQRQEPTTSLKIISWRKHKNIKNKTVYFYYTKHGIHFGIEGKERHRNVNIDIREPQWAFVRITNPGTTLEVLNSSPFDWPILSLEPMMLHHSRGRNVKLIRNAIHKFDRRLKMSYAFTVNPVKIGEHVIIKILDIDCGSRGYLSLGLTSCNPSHLEKELPDDIGLLLTRQGYWTIIDDPSWRFKLSDRISFVITNEGKIKIWRNDSTLLKEVYVDISSDLWVFFDIAAVEGVEISSYILPESQNFEMANWKEVRNDVLISMQHEEELDVEEDDSLCVVCQENATEAALYPCGHMCMCYRCAREQWRGMGHGSCPMCRVKIKDVLKIYKN